MTDQSREYLKNLGELKSSIADAEPANIVWPKIGPGIAWAGIAFGLEIASGVTQVIQKSETVLVQILMIAAVSASLTAVILSLVALNRLHHVLKSITRDVYPIGPKAAAWLHIAPFYNFYWVFRWTGELTRFLNFLDPSEKRGTVGKGLLMLFALIFGRAITGLFPLVLLLVIRDYSKGLFRALKGDDVRSKIDAYAAAPPQKLSGAAGVVVGCLIGVMILGLLAAIAVPNFIQARNAARERAARGETATTAAQTGPASKFAEAKRLMREEGLSAAEASKRVTYGEAERSKESYYEELGIPRESSD